MKKFAIAVAFVFSFLAVSILPAKASAQQETVPCDSVEGFEQGIKAQMSFLEGIGSLDDHNECAIRGWIAEGLLHISLSKSQEDGGFNVLLDVGDTGPAIAATIRIIPPNACTQKYGNAEHKECLAAWINKGFLDTGHANPRSDWLFVQEESTSETGEILNEIFKTATEKRNR